MQERINLMKNKIERGSKKHDWVNMYYISVLLKS